VKATVARRGVLRRPWTVGALAAGSVVLGLVATRAAHSFVPLATDLGSRAACERYSGLPGLGDEAGMVFIPGGELEIGSTRGYPEERGGARMAVASFWIDRTEVSNAQFARFVQATGYVTTAERAGAAPVFVAPTQAELEQKGSYAWWSQVPGASWRHPEGPSSDIARRARIRAHTARTTLPTDRARATTARAPRARR